MLIRLKKPGSKDAKPMSDPLIEALNRSEQIDRMDRVIERSGDSHPKQDKLMPKMVCLSDPRMPAVEGIV